MVTDGESDVKELYKGTRYGHSTVQSHLSNSASSVGLSRIIRVPRQYSAAIGLVTGTDLALAIAEISHLKL